MFALSGIRKVRLYGLAFTLLALTGCSELGAMFVPDHEVVIAANFEALGTAPETAAEKQERIQQSETAIRERLTAVGYTVQSLSIRDDERIALVVSGARNQSRIERLMTTIGNVEFRWVDTEADPAELERGNAPAGRSILRMSDGPELLAVYPKVGLEGSGIVSASASREEETFIPTLTITFNAPGVDQTAETRLADNEQQVAVILDGEILTTSSVPSSGEEMDTKIVGWSTLESAEDLAVVLNQDPLPVPFEIVSFEPLD